MYHLSHCAINNPFDFNQCDGGSNQVFLFPDTACDRLLLDGSIFYAIRDSGLIVEY
jgi:hypothetical protein